MAIFEAVPDDEAELEEIFSDLSKLQKVLEHPLSLNMDVLFKEVLQLEKKSGGFHIPDLNMDDLPPAIIPEANFPSGVDMSDKDQELSLDNLGELEIGPSVDFAPSATQDDGMNISFDTGEGGFDLGNEFSVEMMPEAVEEEPKPSLGDDEDYGEEASDDLGFTLDDGADDADFNLGDEDIESVTLDFGNEESNDLDFSVGAEEISDDAKLKMIEIDAIMDQDASQLDITASSLDEGLLEDNLDFASSSASLDESLVSDDMNFGSLNFGSEDEEVAEIRPTDKLKVVERKSSAADSELREEFREISGAYSGELERTQATIANLRADRQELLAKIQILEDDKIGYNRQQLTTRAELDERKIELAIIRKKLNEEISELKNRLLMQDERKLILEEKNRILMQELDKAGQKNKIDVKKVQMRERELEQKLELLKADAETQIKNRDLKILELKRKIDAMEFDMESISLQEKRSVESRFELEDKLDKAIKTLRSAISNLEDESDRGSALSALKKNIDV